MAELALATNAEQILVRPFPPLPPSKPALSTQSPSADRNAKLTSASRRFPTTGRPTVATAVDALWPVGGEHDSRAVRDPQGRRGHIFARLFGDQVTARTAMLSSELAEAVDAEIQLLNQRDSTFEKADLDLGWTKA